MLLSFRWSVAAPRAHRIRRRAEPASVIPRVDFDFVPVDQLTEEQREIRDLVRDLARERIAPRAAEIDKSAEFPWDVVELFRENEIFGILFGEEFGGIGASAL